MQSKGFNELGMRERHLLSSITVADPTSSRLGRRRSTWFM